MSSRDAAGSRIARVLAALAAVPLLLSCGAEPASTAPSFEVIAAPGLQRVEESVFLQEPAPIVVPTYDGSGQSVHPDVVDFVTPWHGSRFWLTMTPYPKSRQALENPSILVSDDGERVAEPAGLKNPVAPHVGRASDYNSDPELLYDRAADRLVLFHRFVQRKTNTIRVSTSRDGITWVTEKSPFWERSHKAVSPTIVPGEGAAARMWYVDAGKDGCSAKSTRVVTRSAKDPSGRIVGTAWANPVPTDLAIPRYVVWHIKARWIPSKGEYWMLVSAYPQLGNGCLTDDLFFARSSDGLHWTTYAEPLLRHQDREWTAAAVYRSSFTYDAATDELRLWISARGSEGAWRMGTARLRYENMLAALEAGRRLSPAPARTFSVRADVVAGEQP